MDLIVTDSWGLPERAYVSIRVGGTRLQRPFRSNEKFYFPTTHHSTVKVDIFEYLGSAQLPLYSLRTVPDEEAEDESECAPKEVKIGDSMSNAANANGTNNPAITNMGLKMKCIYAEDRDNQAVAGGARGAGKPKSARHEAAMKATKYLDKHGIQKTLQAMIHSLLEEQPTDPLGFMQMFLTQQSLSAMADDDLGIESPTEMSPKQNTTNNDKDGSNDNKPQEEGVTAEKTETNEEASPPTGENEAETKPSEVKVIEEEDDDDEFTIKKEAVTNPVTITDDNIDAKDKLIDDSDSEPPFVEPTADEDDLFAAAMDAPPEQPLDTVGETENAAATEDVSEKPAADAAVDSSETQKETTAADAAPDTAVEAGDTSAAAETVPETAAAEEAATDEVPAVAEDATKPDAGTEDANATVTAEGEGATAEDAPKPAEE